MLMQSVALSEFLLLFLFSGTPADLVSFLEPKMALETLGEATDEANLKRLIEGKAADSKKLAYRLEAAFTEAKQASDMAAYMKGLIAQGMAELERNAAQFSGSPIEDMMKKVREVLKSIGVAAEGKKGVLRGEVDPALLPTGLLGARVVH